MFRDKFNHLGVWVYYAGNCGTLTLQRRLGSPPVGVGPITSHNEMLREAGLVRRAYSSVWPIFACSSDRTFARRRMPLSGIVTLAEFTPKLRPLRFMAL